eukprot:TRINITY_DN14348_c0_g1_i1.p1 TRINITY_DN14348_c0_g1~~TRINITY_DN14348_c0_g1_i1.p1  ORF type:complete len:860 (-),score=91.92 TRINITY_DN14348_c0_g1_i1:288-2840(-)
MAFRCGCGACDSPIDTMSINGDGTTPRRVSEASSGAAAYEGPSEILFRQEFVMERFKTRITKELEGVQKSIVAECHVALLGIWGHQRPASSGISAGPPAFCDFPLLNGTKSLLLEHSSGNRLPATRRDTACYCFTKDKPLEIDDVCIEPETTEAAMTPVHEQSCEHAVAFGEQPNSSSIVEDIGSGQGGVAACSDKGFPCPTEEDEHSDECAVICDDPTDVFARWQSLVRGILEVSNLRRRSEVCPVDEAYNLRMVWTTRPTVVSSSPVRIIELERKEVMRTSLRLERQPFDPIGLLGILFWKAVALLVRHPSSTWDLAWSSIGGMVVIFDIMFLPMVVFDIPDSLGLQIVSLSCSAYWGFDLCFSFLVGYYDGENIEMDPKCIAFRYARTWLVPDVFLVVVDFAGYILESEIGASPRGTGSTLRVARLLRLIRIMRVLRIRKLTSVFNSLFSIMLTDYFRLLVKLLRNIAIIFTFTHYIACAWYALGAYGASLGDDVPSWVRAHGLVGVDMLSLYVTSLHWSLTQFTPSTQNIAPQSTHERIFASVVVLLALVSFSTFVSGVTNAVNEMLCLNMRRAKEASVLRNFIREWGISKELSQYIIQKHRNDLRHKRSRVQQKELSSIVTVSTNVSIKLHLEMYAPLLTSNLVLNRLLGTFDAREMLQTLCHQAVTYQTYSKQDEIFCTKTEAIVSTILLDGEAVYTITQRHRPAKSILLDPGKSTELISEAAIWCDWEHRGDLLAMTSVCATELQVASFGKIVRVSDYSLFMLARRLAIMFTVFAKRMMATDDEVSDIPLSVKSQEWIVDKSTQFEGLCPSSFLGRKASKSFGSAISVRAIFSRTSRRTVERR